MMDCLPQGLKPRFFGMEGRPKAEALGYLEANAKGLEADAKATAMTEGIGR
jgi:hypothetical protein